MDKETMISEMRAWSSVQDWQHAQAVVAIDLSDNDDFIKMVLGCSPIVKIFCYDKFQPRDASREKVFVSNDLMDFRGDIIDNMSISGNFIFAKNPGTEVSIEKEVLSVTNEARQYFLTMQHTSRSNAKDWCDIGLEIFVDLIRKPIFNFFPEIFKGFPGIVIGAGPSLDSAIPRLKEIQDKVVIFASNSSAIPLYNAGIQPHFITAIEKKGLSIEPLLDHPVMKKSYFVPGVHTYPPAYRADCKGIFPAIQMVGPVGQWFCSNLGVEPVHTGGSVSTVAFRLADKTGCDPIILVGCDCAQGADNTKLYVNGVAHETGGYNGMQIFKVKAWGGIGHVMSPTTLNTYRHWFENRVEENRARLINASIGGASIHGWEEIELKDIDFDKKIDIDPIIEKAVAGFPVLDERDIVSKLEYQMAESAAFAKYGRDALSAARKLDSSIRKFMDKRHKFNITLGSAASPLDELRKLPKDYQIKAVIDKMSRLNSFHYENRNKIRSICERLREC